MMTVSSNCENCGAAWTVKYGSGRFCSASCARGFSTKSKREEINAKVSVKMKGVPTGRVPSAETIQKMKDSKKAAHDARPFDQLGITLKRKIVAEEQNHRCNKCGLKDWLGEEITLELEHKDGNSSNNARENLEFLCPNCHSQTPTWRGRNKGRTEARRLRTDDDIANALIAHNGSRYAALGALDLPQKGKSYARITRIANERGIDIGNHRGHRSAAAKLSLEQAREIRERHANGESLRSLAPTYGVHHATISAVVRGISYVE